MKILAGIGAGVSAAMVVVTWGLDTALWIPALWAFNAVILSLTAVES